MKYKILHGFNTEDYIEINAEEVQKAFYCFLEKKDSVFSGGAIRGANILGVKPDFHRTMGWNRGYKLGDMDFAEITDKGLDKKMQKFLEGEKEKVNYLIQTNQQHLIGTKFEMPRIESPLRDEIVKLAESKKI